MSKKSNLSNLSKICQVITDLHLITISIKNPNKRKLKEKIGAKEKTKVEVDLHSRTCSTRKTRHRQEAKLRIIMLQIPNNPLEEEISIRLKKKLDHLVRIQVETILNSIKMMIILKIKAS